MLSLLYVLIGADRADFSTISKCVKLLMDSRRSGTGPGGFGLVD